MGQIGPTPVINYRTDTMWRSTSKEGGGKKKFTGKKKKEGGGGEGGEMVAEYNKLSSSIECKNPLQ